MVWVIGASGGLGRATAQAFAQNGWSVIAGARSFAAGTSPLGEGVTVLPLDVTSEESCTAFVKKALGMENRVDVLVCAAAQLVLGSCENTTVDELDKLLNVNVLGTVRMIQRALPLMRAQKSGKIILFSSINGLLGIPFQSAYTASKHALEGYAECLAMETADFGILRVIVSDPDKALEALKKHHFGVSLTDVVCLNCPNTPGALAKALGYLSDENVFIEYMYAFAAGDVAHVVIRPDNIENCIRVLTEHRLELMAAHQLYKL